MKSISNWQKVLFSLGLAAVILFVAGFCWHSLRPRPLLTDAGFSLPDEAAVVSVRVTRSSIEAPDATKQGSREQACELIQAFAAARIAGEAPTELILGEAPEFRITFSRQASNSMVLSLLVLSDDGTKATGVLYSGETYLPFEAGYQDAYLVELPSIEQFWASLPSSSPAELRALP